MEALATDAVPTLGTDAPTVGSDVIVPELSPLMSLITIIITAKKIIPPTMYATTLPIEVDLPAQLVLPPDDAQLPDIPVALAVACIILWSTQSPVAEPV